MPLPKTFHGNGLEKTTDFLGGGIEQGALWVPAMLRRMDLAQQTFQKTEPALRLPMAASDYIRRQVRFTPFPTEPVP